MNGRRMRVLTLIVATTIGVGGVLASGVEPAFAAGSLPVHWVTDDCQYSGGLGGHLGVVQAGAYGTVTYPNQEWVAWTPTLQKWTGRTWANVASSSPGWMYFQTSAGYDPTKLVPGSLIAPLEWPNLAGGTYRIASRFYWYQTGTYSPWEYTAPCNVIGFVIG